MQGISKDGEIMTRLVWWLSLYLILQLSIRQESSSSSQTLCKTLTQLWRGNAGVGQQHQDSEQEEGRGMVGNTSGEVDFSNSVLDTQKAPVDEDMQCSTQCL